MKTRLALLPLFLAACTGPPSAAVHQYPIVGGSTDTGDPAVGEVLIEDARGQIWAVCTGTLISRKVVVTAAHCVNIEDPNLPPVSPKQVFFGTTLKETGGRTYNVVKTAVHPTFNEARIEDGGDIALLLLSESPGITPVPMNRTKLEGHEGENVRLVGFGITSGTSNDDSTKRQVTTTLDQVAPKLLWFFSSNRNTCHGDSGGPTFMRVNGQEVIAGVTSFGDENCVQEGANTRVDLFAASFVDPFVSANDPSTTPPGPTTTTDHCGADGTCQKSCSSPDPDCNLASMPPVTGTCTGSDCPMEVTADDQTVSGGCSVGARHGGAEAAMLLLAALFLVHGRRRRRRRA